MNIFWLHSHFKHPNGAAKYVHQTAWHLTLSGNDVIVFLEDKAGEVSRQKLWGLHSFSSYSKIYWARFSKYLESSVRKLQEQVDKKRPDVIVASMFPLTLVLDRLKTNAKKVIFCFEPYVYFHDQETIQGLPIHTRLMFKYLKSKYGQLEQLAFQNCDKILTYTDYVRPFIREVYSRDASSIGMGVEPRELSQTEKGYIFHSTDGSPLKHTEYLTKSRRVFNHFFPDVGIKISNNKKDKFAEADFSSLCRDATLGVYMGSGAAGVQSLFVLEMMALGKCVVRPDTSGEVQDGITGRTFRAGDLHDFQNVVLSVLGDHEQRYRLGRAAREHVREKYRWKDVAKRFIEEVS